MASAVDVLTTWRVVDQAAPTKPLFSCKDAVEANAKMAEQQKKDAKHGNKRVLEVVEHKKKATRGREKSKLNVVWHAPEVVYEKDGKHLLYLPHHKDIATLGQLQHHCAMTHWVWCCDTDVWGFFALTDENGNPHGTLHTKNAAWVGKRHPLDSAKPAVSEAMVREYKRRQSGEHASSYYYGGGYPTFAEYEAACKEAGVEHIPGTHGPLSYKSSTYEYGILSSARDFGGVKDKSEKKPKVLSFDEWFETKKDRYERYGYTKQDVRYAYEDYVYMTRNPGHEKWEGIRPAKFKDIHIVVQSCSGTGQSGGKGSYYSLAVEWYKNNIDKEAPLVPVDKVDRW